MNFLTGRGTKSPRARDAEAPRAHRAMARRPQAQGARVCQEGGEAGQLGQQHSAADVQEVVP